MKILGIDSSGMVASVAIIQDDVIKAEYTMNHKKTHSQTLLPMLDQIVKDAEIELSGIDVTGCPNLYWLLCNGNGIDSLDISNCPKLTDLMQSAEAEDWTDGSIAYRDGDFRMLCFDPGTEIETG